MWLLPSRGREAMCQVVLDACADTKMAAPGIVYVDHRAGEYQLKLPDNWRQAGGLMDLQPAKQLWVNAFPDQQAYGVLCDDNFPETDYWDQEMEAASERWNIVDCFDGWLGINMAEAQHGLLDPKCIAGDLIQAVGWISLPRTVRAGGGAVWSHIHNRLHNRKHLKHVRVIHKHWRNLGRDLDGTDADPQTDRTASHDMHLVDQWVKTGGLDQAINRIKSAMHNA